MALKPEDRFIIVESLLKSLDEPDEKLDDIWADEAERRLMFDFRNKTRDIVSP
ncbi:MAG: addiction module protein [Mariprofundus sp.]|nr:addiction module protein [Mariprofundus sp.]